MDNENEERRRQSRLELASKLSAALGFALTADLQSEAALIAKLIESTITNRVGDLYIKLTFQPKDRP